MDKLELKNIAVEQGLDFDGVIELVFDAQQAKVEELQKRIDDSIFILSTIDNPDEAYIAIDLLLRALRGEQALKGEVNDQT